MAGDPEYNLNSTALAKHRRRARAAGGVMAMDRESRVQYAEAVEAAVRSSQRSFLNSHGESAPKPMCASGTFHSDGEAIIKAVLTQQRAKLAAYPSRVRRSRSDVEWEAMYREAMAAKRKAQRKQRRAEESQRLTMGKVSAAAGEMCESG